MPSDDREVRTDGGGEAVSSIPGRDCPDCGVPMAGSNTGYVYLWDCENDDCGNADGYWRIYDWETFGHVKAVQREAGQQAAERLAAEFKRGVLA